MKQNLHRRLIELARNLWWTWNADAQRLFAAIDPVVWNTSGHDPSALIGEARLAKYKSRLQEDSALLRLLQSCETQFSSYLRRLIDI